MSQLLHPSVLQLIETGGDGPDPLLESMEEYGSERSFPIVGRDVGRLLRVIAMLGGAERVFEFGSGFGYSAAWIAEALPTHGEVHLTDFDEENLDAAREFLDDGGYGEQAVLHHGDAMDSFTDTSGEFDMVLIDHDKTLYTAAFDLVTDRLAEGGVVVADNMMAGPVDPENVQAALAGEVPVDDVTDGIATYIERLRDDPDFETSLVPLGQGVAVSVRQR